MSTARFLEYVWPFYNITHERVKSFQSGADIFSIFFSFQKLGTGAIELKFLAGVIGLMQICKQFKAQDSQNRKRGNFR